MPTHADPQASPCDAHTAEFHRLIAAHPSVVSISPDGTVTARIEVRHRAEVEWHLVTNLPMPSEVAHLVLRDPHALLDWVKEHRRTWDKALWEDSVMLDSSVDDAILIAATAPLHSSHPESERPTEARRPTSAELNDAATASGG